MPKLLERRICPGSVDNEPVMIQQWLALQVPALLEMGGEHWFDVRETGSSRTAEEIVDSHNNRILTGGA